MAEENNEPDLLSTPSSNDADHTAATLNDVEGASSPALMLADTPIGSDSTQQTPGTPSTHNNLVSSPMPISDAPWMPDKDEVQDTTQPETPSRLKTRKKLSVTLQAKRGQYGRHIEFVLTCIGLTVGLGNIWRFPYLCYKNGGGTFLIPYLTFLCLIGFPIVYLELALGQFVGSGAITIFRLMSPLFSGLGWGMNSVALLGSIYYNMVMAWILVYFAYSFRSTLLWTGCTHDWNTDWCYTDMNKTCEDEVNNKLILLNSSATRIKGIIYAKQCYSAGSLELKEALNYYNSVTVFPAEEFYNNFVLGKSESIYKSGGMQWKLFLGLFISWACIFGVLCRGIQSSGKVVYVTVLFPYVILTILVIHGLTLDGAMIGITFYLKPNLTKLLSFSIWTEAAEQIFFTLDPGMGALSAIASFGDFRNNVHRDALIIGIVNALTSLFAGFAIFSTTGFLAHRMGKSVTEVAKDGQGLAFEIYPEALARMPGAPFFSIIFFLMMFTLGLDSQLFMTDTLITSLMDEFPRLRDNRGSVIAFICLFLFLLGVPMCFQNGIYIFTLFNDFCASFGLLVVTCIELIIVSYIYGLKRFRQDIEMMMGLKKNCFRQTFGSFGLYWQFSWALAAPFLVLREYEPISYLVSYGVIMCLPIYLVAGFAVHALVKRHRQKLPWKWLITPMDGYKDHANQCCVEEDLEKRRQEAAREDTQQLSEQTSIPIEEKP